MTEEVKKIAFYAVPHNPTAKKRLVEYVTMVLRAFSIPYEIVTEGANIVLVATPAGNGGFVPTREWNSIQKQNPGAEITGFEIVD